MTTRPSIAAVDREVGVIKRIFEIAPDIYYHEITSFASENIPSCLVHRVSDSLLASCPLVVLDAKRALEAANPPEAAAAAGASAAGFLSKESK